MKPLVWVGHFRGTSGFATATREYARAFMRHYPEVSISPLAALEPSDTFAKFVISLPVPQGAFELVHHLPTTDPMADAYFSVIEYDRAPAEWGPLLDQAKVVFTQSNFCKKIFTKMVGDPSKIYIVPYILPPGFSPRGPRQRFFPSSTFVVGSAFEWIPRKLPELLIRAFVEEFSSVEPVALVLRTYNVPDGTLEAVLAPLEGNKNIMFLGAPVDDMPAFYRGLDCYCSCTAGEGYGQTLAEAMACGVSTVASRHSGNLDFMTDDNSYLVDVGPWEPVPEGAGEQWKIPKVDGIKTALRQVYEHWAKKERDYRTRRAAGIRRSLTPWHASRIMFRALKAFLFT
ncbi:MAG TPA: glycosyltransferase [Candidatus Lokiarchaeia archaeon]|nr:glycosyltransferase [Candidatus Lokiarchaeia archaeon]